MVEVTVTLKKANFEPRLGISKGPHDGAYNFDFQGFDDEGSVNVDLKIRHSDVAGYIVGKDYTFTISEKDVKAGPCLY